MEYKDIPLPAQPPSSASGIMEIAESHIRPRRSFAQVAKAQMAKARAKQSDQDNSVSARDMLMNAKKLLMLIIVVPFLPISRYYDLLGLNYREGNTAKNSAIQKKLLLQHDFHSGRRGGKIVLAEPTGAAFAMFKLPPMFENPGYMHIYLQDSVKGPMTAQGWKVSIEKCVNGKNIDVVLERDNERVAVEIAVTDKHEVINVRKDIFQAGFDRVVIIGKDRKTVSAVGNKICAAFSIDILSKVRCCVLADFIDGKTK